MVQSSDYSVPGISDWEDTHWGWPKTRWEDYISHHVCLKIPQKEVEDDGGGDGHFGKSAGHEWINRCMDLILYNRHLKLQICYMYYVAGFLCTHIEIWGGIEELLLSKPELLLWTLSRPRHNTMSGMQHNSRSIATAASLFICSYDMWVWWGWLSGCMTAKSVLLNTVIVSKPSCVGPWHNQKMLKFAPFSRVQLLWEGNEVK